MNKKIKISIIFAIVLLAVVLLFLVLSIEKKYSDEPMNWVEERKGISTIDVEQATQGKGVDEGTELELNINGIRTAFLYEGVYKGEYFQKEFYEGNQLKMKIGNQMNPHDGVIEGFVIEKIIDNTYTVYVFLDEDWKRQLANTHIIFGAGYSSSKPFTFTEISDGIFMDQIEDDPTRFDYNHKMSFSGIIVGDLTKEDVKSGVTEGVTAIIFQ